MQSTIKVIAIALCAGLLGIVAAIALNGPTPLLRTELGQRILQRLFASTATRPPHGVRVAQRGEVVPDLALRDRDGRMVIFPKAFAGQRVLVNVWATWCAPCRREMPELDRFSAEQAGNRIRVVGIALDDAAAVDAFLREVRVRYPVLIGRPGPADAGVRLGNPKSVLPYSVLIDVHGRLVKQRIGPFADGEIEDWAAN